MEEQELAILCARGDNAARRELYIRYGSRILALCRRYVSDPADAEDLKQDAFVKIFRVIGRFRWTRPGSLYAWMSRVTINMAFDSYGKRRRLAATGGRGGDGECPSGRIHPGGGRLGAAGSTCGDD
jgi:DNA-directed RNA polymerase specialized sigma subunit, sigma24 homolog